MRHDPSPSTIERAIAAIRTTHELAGLPKPETKAARKILTGYGHRLALAKDPAARPHKASPAEPDALWAMPATLDRTTLAGQRDAVLFLLGYATAARGRDGRPRHLRRGRDHRGDRLFVRRHDTQPSAHRTHLRTLDPQLLPLRAWITDGSLLTC
ncbi:hypothetical protein AB0L65_40440 [Nonomuraea sp. NPDC052116]|uniref:hypothetical protein n=1 Tax=Nonomuraea sp. NPDC052116 TaxID=3155665 RepID=UPI003426F3D5